MKTNSPRNQFWDDSSCTVSTEYNESPSKNSVYHWKGNANALEDVTKKSKSEKTILKQPILDDNSCFQKFGGKPERRSLNSSKQTLLHPQNSKSRGSYNKVLEKFRKSSSRDVLHFVKNSEKIRSLNWKEKCEVNKMISSSRILFQLNKKP
ncbi:unnamed protein product [Moneuplotes crassus]|uniref:Uncharacterized protein n=1 Tax=Euplotes crassus TaxID=5936 RepID=A0AAD1U5X7_EUPCR|nr:unnamed protein product [Moneuplotes crassus]